MRVISLLNEKGGVGKTTLATHLAAGLAIDGARVLLVDADPQANATSSVGLQPKGDFYDLCVRGAEWKDVLTSVHPDVYNLPDTQARGRLIMLRSNIETRNVPNSMSDNLLIRQRIRELKGAIDFVVVDTSPTPSLLHQAIAIASDYIIIPTDCEAFSAFEGLPRTIAHIERLHEAGKAQNVQIAELLAIIPNKRRRTVIHMEVLENMTEKYGNYVWPELPLSTKLAEAQAMQQFVYGLYPDDPLTEMLWEMVMRVRQAVAV